MPKTVEDIIEALPPDDARILFWEMILQWIKEKRYGWIYVRLSQHSADSDIVQQYEAVARTIARMFP